MTKNKKDRLNIIYEDKAIIVINKPSNLLCISTEKEKINTLFHKVIDYEKKKNKSNKVFIVHRLDKDTSGLIVFAKSESVKKFLQDNWDKTKREYVALVEGNVKSGSTIKNWLRETSTLLTYSSDKPNDGKLAITKYKPIISTKEYSLLSLEILTGRKNQIRVHMHDISHPIVGDKKYGSVKNPIRRMCLHATHLEIIHPITKKFLKFNCNYPEIFNKLINKDVNNKLNN